VIRHALVVGVSGITTAGIAEELPACREGDHLALSGSG
jgi:hypothetical protein